MYRTVKARVKAPGGISKEFDLGVNALQDELEIELTEKFSVCVKKRDLLIALGVPELKKEDKE